MKRISNPSELVVGDKITYTIDDSACIVIQKLGRHIVVEWPGGSCCTYSPDEPAWQFFRREKPKKVYRMRARTPKRGKQERSYIQRCRAFIRREQETGTGCPVALAILQEVKPVDQIHHRAGREGDLLLNEKHWLAVSQWGHDWIRDHPDEAREHGWLYEVNKQGKITRR